MLRFSRSSSIWGGGTVGHSVRKPASRPRVERIVVSIKRRTEILRCYLVQYCESTVGGAVFRQDIKSKTWPALSNGPRTLPSHFFAHE